MEYLKKALKYEQQVDSLFQFVRNHPEFSLDNSDWTASMDYSILKSYVGNCSSIRVIIISYRRL